MKIGFDIHGVIDYKPEFFSDLSKLVRKDNNELHVITGSSINNKIKDSLEKWKIDYSYVFSITDYHVSLGSSIKFDEKGNPWMKNVLWDRTKGDYCKKEKIDFHIDDSDIYGNYFKTIYCRFYKEREVFKWRYEDKKIGEFLLTEPEFVYGFIKSIVSNLK